MKIYVDDFYYELEFTDLGMILAARSIGKNIRTEREEEELLSRGNESDSLWYRLRLIKKKKKKRPFLRDEKRCNDVSKRYSKRGSIFESLSKIFPSPFFLFYLSTSPPKFFYYSRDYEQMPGRHFSFKVCTSLIINGWRRISSIVRSHYYPHMAYCANN